jgi:hypothetical protein
VLAIDLNEPEMLLRAFSTPLRSKPDNSAFAEVMTFKFKVLKSIIAKIPVNTIFVYFIFLLIDY